MRQNYESIVSVNLLLQGSGHTYLKQKIKAVKLKQILHSSSVVLQNAKSNGQEANAVKILQGHLRRFFHERVKKFRHKSFRNRCKQFWSIRNKFTLIRKSTDCDNYQRRALWIHKIWSGSHVMQPMHCQLRDAPKWEHLKNSNKNIHTVGMRAMKR